MTFDSERIGPYRLRRVLGEGGMGDVYEAEQLEPVRRLVALKLLKIGMDTKSFIARFEIERQALAVMDHPNIAKVLDAGAIDGRPYYVMELVPGTSLTTFCDEHRLSTRERLALFLDLCSAVHHAHQKGVIHRDLKPSNVLVSRHDDRPAAHVIDFGIAKALGRPLTDITLVTEFGEPLGTPAYMSPEQWAGEQDIDTRTDIYSMGVMLYELLSGRLPYEARHLVRAGSGAHDMLRALTPPTPSTLVRSLGRESDTLAHARRTDPRSWARDLRGDLDWITLRAMAPDRRRRYETARELALDIERHLRAEPVVARPPSTRYRIGRFVVRNRIGVGIAGGMLAAGIGFTALTVVDARRVARERDRATAEAAKARALNSFLERTLLSPDPIDGIGRDATMLQAIDSAAARLAREPAGQPVVDASVRSAIGWAYFRLGLYDKAEPLMRAALATREALSTPDSAGLAESIVRVAQLEEKRANYAEAARLFARGVALRRATMSADTAGLASALVFAGSFHRDRGDTAQAIASFREADSLFRQLGDSSGAASIDNQLGVLEYGRGNLQEAERLLQRSLAFRRQRLGKHPLVAGDLSNLGALLEDLKRPSEAETAYREALDIGVATLGEEHDIVTSMLNNLGVLLTNLGKFADAQVYLRKALAIDEKKLGAENPAVGVDLVNLSLAICRGAATAEGATLAERAARILSSKTGPEAWEPGYAKTIAGQCLTRIGRFDDAERELTLGLRILERTLGASHRRADTARVRLAELAAARGGR